MNIRFRDTANGILTHPSLHKLSWIQYRVGMLEVRNHIVESIELDEVVFKLRSISLQFARKEDAGSLAIDFYF